MGGSAGCFSCSCGGSHLKQARSRAVGGVGFGGGWGEWSAR